MSKVELGKRLERPTFTPYSELDLLLAKGRHDKEKGAVVRRTDEALKEEKSCSTQ